MHRHLSKQKKHRLDELRQEHERLKSAVSELLNRVNEIDLASKYQRNQDEISRRIGEISAEAGKLADAVEELEKLLNQADVQQANKVLLKSLTNALQLSNDINRIRSELI